MWNNKLASLRVAIATWAFMGLIGIPAFVYFDLFNGWRWRPYNAIYEQMIASIYVAIGACSVLSFKNPLQHLSFLWFVVLSSFTHGGVMLFRALHEPSHAGHLIGDVWILAGGLGLAVLLWGLKHHGGDRH